MDPLTLATAYATVVSLIGQFRNERRESTNDDLQGFLDFLSNQGHEEIRQLLEANQVSTVGIKALLSQSTEQILEKLEYLDQGMASLSTGIANLRDVAAVIHPNSQLSEQAIGLLRQLEESGAAGFFIGTPTGAGQPVLHVISGAVRQLQGIKSQYLRDDLAILVELQLLREEKNPEGRPRYWMTKSASNIIAQIDS